MPKIKESETPLHHLWRATGLSQTAFAKECGVTIGTLRNLLDADRPSHINLELARLLAVRFGVSQRSMLQKKGQAQDPLGNNYTKEHWERFNEGWTEWLWADKESVVQVIDETINNHIRSSLSSKIHPRDRSKFIQRLLLALGQNAWAPDSGFYGPEEETSWKFSRMFSRPNNTQRNPTRPNT